MTIMTTNQQPQDESKIMTTNPHLKSVRAYIDALVWDGQPRIDRWLSSLAGAQDSPYVRAASRAVLVAAVRRARHPGCQIDELLVLEGPQGSGKSAALRILAVDDAWFTDEVRIGASAVEAPVGKWIVELTELRRRGASAAAELNAFLVSPDDRPVYRWDAGRVPRAFVVVGTTTDTESLQDPTENRRFWPVRVQRFDLARLRADRDQLWAEAAEAEALGESIRLNPALYEAAAVEQEARLRGDDPMVDVLQRVLANRTGKLRVSDAFLICGIEAGKANQDQIERFGRAIRELGWERKRCRFNGGFVYAYVKGTEAERALDLVVEYDPNTRSVRIEIGRPEAAQAVSEPEAPDLRLKILRFLVQEWSRKDSRQLVSVDLMHAPGGGYRDEEIRCWERADEPALFTEVVDLERLTGQIIEVAENEVDAKPMGKYRFVVRTQQYGGSKMKLSFVMSPKDFGADEPATAGDQYRTSYASAPPADRQEGSAYVVINSAYGVEFSSLTLDAACTYVSDKLRVQALETALINPSSYRIKQVKAG